MDRTKIRLPKPGAIERLAVYRRINMSDFILMHYFKCIRYQCKYGDRKLDTLLEYINELEYRGLKYRL